jgi:hypothetical protein
MNTPITTTDIEMSNSLADLAARITAEHTAVSAALSDSVRHAVAAGEMLIEAKTQVPHGQWLPWLRDNCTMSERTAQLYMRCAKSREDIEQHMGGGGDLTLNEAAAMLVLSSDTRKLFAFVKEIERLDDPEEVMQACLRSGVALFAGTIDYHSGYSDDEEREWLLFTLYMVRHIRWTCDGADHHVCWLKRHAYKTPSEWMGEEGDKHRRQMPIGTISDEAKQWWKDLLAQTQNLDLDAINQTIAEEDKALMAEIAAMPSRRRRRRRNRNALRI